MTGLVRVRLLELPVEIYVRAAAHGDALARELELLRHREPGRHPLPERLAELTEELNGRFQGFTDAPQAALQSAIDQGATSIDLDYHVPAEAGDASVRLGSLLDEIDEWCASGEHLLTLTTPPEAKAFRDWFLGEFTRQCAGGPPHSWPKFLARRVGVGDESFGPGAAGGVPDAGVPEGANPLSEEPANGLPAGWWVERRDGDLVLRLSGAVDLAIAPTLRDLFQDLRDQDGRVVVDAQDVSFLDSVGVSVIVAAYSRLHEDGRDLVVDPSGRVRRVFEIAGLSRLLRDPSP